METIKSLELAPGSVGAFIEDLPLLTSAHVRPFVVAILLHRGAVKPEEVIAALVPHCRASDIKVGEWDPLEEDYCEGTRLERLTDEVLGEFVSEGIVRYNEEQDLWILTSNDIPRVISWVTALGARMPQHLLSELSRHKFVNLPTNTVPFDPMIIRETGMMANASEDKWDGTDIEPGSPRVSPRTASRQRSASDSGSNQKDYPGA